MPDQGLISFAATFPSILPFLLKEFLAHLPKAKFIQNQALFRKRNHHQLKNKRLMFVYLHFLLYTLDIEWLPLIDEEIFLSVPPGHHFADRKKHSS